MIDKLKFYTTLYGKLYNRKFLPSVLLSPIRKLMRIFASYQLPYYLKSAPYPTPIVNCDNVIVSLTTFPDRIGIVWMTISCMLRQTYKPYKIILWLSKEQFKSKDELPIELLSLEDDCFKIVFVEDDLRSHKKYLYAFQGYSDKLIITVDDDLIYSPKLVESLVKAHSQYPEDVLCKYGKSIGYGSDGSILPYNNWKVATDVNDKNIFFGSGGGTLFQPSKMYKDVTNTTLSQKLAPLADDVWLNSMCRLAKLNIRLVAKELFLFFDKDESASLSHTNVGMLQNDKQLNDVINYYKDNYGIEFFQKRI